MLSNDYEKVAKDRKELWLCSSTIKSFSKNSYDPWPYNKSNTQATLTSVSLNLFNFRQCWPFFLQSSIKSNIYGKQNIKLVQISKQYHVFFIA